MSEYILYSRPPHVHVWIYILFCKPPHVHVRIYPEVRYTIPCSQYILTVYILYNHVIKLILEMDHYIFKWLEDRSFQRFFLKNVWWDGWTDKPCLMHLSLVHSQGSPAVLCVLCLDLTVYLLIDLLLGCWFYLFIFVCFIPLFSMLIMGILQTQLKLVDCVYDQGYNLSYCVTRDSLRYCVHGQGYSLSYCVTRDIASATVCMTRNIASATVWPGIASGTVCMTRDIASATVSITRDIASAIMYDQGYSCSYCMYDYGYSLSYCMYDQGYSLSYCMYDQGYSLR